MKCAQNSVPKGPSFQDCPVNRATQRSDSMRMIKSVTEKVLVTISSVTLVKLSRIDFAEMVGRMWVGTESNSSRSGLF